MNPYWGVDFFQFFFLLFKRIFTLQILHPEADEIQLGVLAIVAITCGVIAPFLVLKKMTMFANALSHTMLAGVISSFLLTSFLWQKALYDPVTLLIGALGASLITAFLTEGMTRVFKLQQEGSVGLIFSTLFALGVIGATVFTKNIHLSTEMVLGNTDTLTLVDFWFVLPICALVVIVIPFFFRRLQLSTFDPSFAGSIGIKPSYFHFLLLFLTSIVCVASFRAVGTLLVLSFLTGPYLIARLFSNKLSQILILSPMIALVLSSLGVALSRHVLSVLDLPLSTGGLIVTLIGLAYAASLAFVKKNLLKQRQGLKREK